MIRMEKVPKTISSKGDVDHDIGSEESPLLADDTIKIPLDEEQVLSEAAPSDDVDATMEESEVVAINDVVVTHDEKKEQSTMRLNYCYEIRQYQLFYLTNSSRKTNLK